MHYANNAYRKIARETADPRHLEAMLLLEAAAKLQEVHDSWCDKPSGPQRRLDVTTASFGRFSSTL